MEAYERDLNRHLQLQEQQENAYLQFETEVFDDVKELGELDRQIEKLQEQYDSKLSSLLDTARKYGSKEYDFTDELINLLENLWINYYTDWL